MIHSEPLSTEIQASAQLISPSCATAGGRYSRLDELLDIKRAAKVLGISPKTLRDHVRYRRIEYVKIGGRVLFRGDKLWELIERCTVPALVQ